MTAIPLTLIAAVARNGVIGAQGAMPWHLPSDLKQFKATTLGKPVLMGRATYQSIGRPLPGRLSVVVTRDEAFAAPGVLVARNLDAALAAASSEALRRGGEIIVAGGADIYAQTIGRADRLLITEVDAAPDGDSRFPVIDPAIWRLVDRGAAQRGPNDSAAFTLARYARR